MDRLELMSILGFRFDNIWFEVANLGHEFFVFRLRNLKLLQGTGQMIDDNIELLFRNP